MTPAIDFLMSVLKVAMTPSRRRPVMSSSTSVRSGKTFVQTKPRPLMPNGKRIIEAIMSIVQIIPPPDPMKRPTARPATMSGVTIEPHFFLPNFIVSA